MVNSHKKQNFLMIRVPNFVLPGAPIVGCTWLVKTHVQVPAW